MLRFIEKKLSGQKLPRIQNVNGEILCGYQSKISVTIDGMLKRPVQNNDELNGQVGIYRAKFRVDNNRIYAVKDLNIIDSTNTGANPIEQYRTGEEHIGRISGKLLTRI